MATTMAATRQPFAPLNGSRLQNLTSLKNRQNAITTLSSPSKRKAETFEDISDSENVDPIHFLSPKKLKSPDGSGVDTLKKPVNYFALTKAPSPSNGLENTLKAATSPRRPILTARSPAPRLNTTKITPLTAPAGRSPTRKRVGILNRRKTGSPFTRVDPPKFGASSTSSLGFSIDAALSGTIPSYAKRTASGIKGEEMPIPVLHQPEAREGWFFDIHEDTPEELATNMMEHSTGALDISSDEESVARLRDERGKENVPPVDDISQTRGVAVAGEVAASESSMNEMKAKAGESRRRREVEEGACDIDRSPLGEMKAEDFYAEGCDGESVVVVVEGEEHPSSEVPVEEASVAVEAVEAPSLPTFDFIASLGNTADLSIDALMQKDTLEVAPKAALLEPIEKAEEGFALWESPPSSPSRV